MFGLAYPDAAVGLRSDSRYRPIRLVYLQSRWSVQLTILIAARV